MAIEHWDARQLFSQPLPPEVQAAEDARVQAIIDGLPDASGTFSGHLVRDACYEPNGCCPGCPVPADVAAESLGMRNPN